GIPTLMTQLGAGATLSRLEAFSMLFSQAHESKYWNNDNTFNHYTFKEAIRVSIQGIKGFRDTTTLLGSEELAQLSDIEIFSLLFSHIHEDRYWTGNTFNNDVFKKAIKGAIQGIRDYRDIAADNGSDELSQLSDTEVFSILFAQARKAAYWDGDTFNSAAFREAIEDAIQGISAFRAVSIAQGKNQRAQLSDIEIFSMLFNSAHALNAADRNGKNIEVKEGRKLQQLFQRIGKTMNERLVNLCKALAKEHKTSDTIEDPVLKALFEARDEVMASNNPWQTFARSEAGKKLIASDKTAIREFIKAHAYRLLQDMEGVDPSQEAKGLNCVGVHVLAARIAASFDIHWGIVFVEGLESVVEGVKTGHVALIDKDTKEFIELSVRYSVNGDFNTPLADRYGSSLAEGKKFEDMEIILLNVGQDRQVTREKLKLSEYWDAYGKWIGGDMSIEGFSPETVLAVEKIKTRSYAEAKAQLAEAAKLAKQGDLEGAQRLRAEALGKLPGIKLVLKRLAANEADSQIPGLKEMLHNIDIFMKNPDYSNIPADRVRGSMGAASVIAERIAKRFSAMSEVDTFMIGLNYADRVLSENGYVDLVKLDRLMAGADAVFNAIRSDYKEKSDVELFMIGLRYAERVIDKDGKVIDFKLKILMDGRMFQLTTSSEDKTVTREDYLDDSGRFERVHQVTVNRDKSQATLDLRREYYADGKSTDRGTLTEINRYGKVVDRQEIMNEFDASGRQLEAHLKIFDAQGRLIDQRNELYGKPNELGRVKVTGWEATISYDKDGKPLTTMNVKDGEPASTEPLKDPLGNLVTTFKPIDRTLDSAGHLVQINETTYVYDGTTELTKGFVTRYEEDKPVIQGTVNGKPSTDSWAEPGGAAVKLIKDNFKGSFVEKELNAVGSFLWKDSGGRVMTAFATFGFSEVAHFGVYTYQNWDNISSGLKVVGDAAVTFFKPVGEALTPVGEAISGYASVLYVGLLKPFGQWIGGVSKDLGRFLYDVVVDQGGALLSYIGTGLSQLVQYAVSYVAARVFDGRTHEDAKTFAASYANANQNLLSSFGQTVKVV
ncbi:MAG: hypothetical protein HY589_04585, partial [Candidatus Omnitrophica bacterium]|nr:hypothetical protein [Candidatus Omnitrophota bacterium]